MIFLVLSLSVYFIVCSIRVIIGFVVDTVNCYPEWRCSRLMWVVDLRLWRNWNLSKIIIVPDQEER